MFLEKNASIAIGEPPQRIHVLTGIAAVTFTECYTGREFFRLEELKIPFIGLAALVKTKTALHHDQDELDIKRLREIQARRGKMTKN